MRRAMAISRGQTLVIVQSERIVRTIRIVERYWSWRWRLPQIRIRIVERSRAPVSLVQFGSRVPPHEATQVAQYQHDRRFSDVSPAEVQGAIDQADERQGCEAGHERERDPRQHAPKKSFDLHDFPIVGARVIEPFNTSRMYMRL